ncbi:MAG TPA: peptidase M19, partial [Marinobacter adhaerens]|nr:peptidase M19 [Marinobacter adhaerens]
MLTIDGLQYSNWSRAIFEQMREGGVDAVHATLVYHENCRETLLRFGEWQRRFEEHSDLIMPVFEASDIELARETNRVGIFFGAQNCSPIEDDIDLVAIMRRLGLLIMQLTYNNQSLLACGCYEAEDSGITRF